MLHPSQFEVNEAWIAFRLNSVPIRTERDGDFNRIALMDAKRHKQQLPRSLFVPSEDSADQLILEAEQLGLEVVRVAESELIIFIGEVREVFAERFGGS